MIKSAIENSELPPSNANLYPLPRIIWVAARPPIPPFSGITAKTLCGLDALSSLTEVDLITFTDESSSERTVAALQDYWGSRHIRVHIEPLQTKINWFKALLRRQFQLTSGFNRNILASKLTELQWDNPHSLVIFDDIVLAPLAQAYGANAILSPHDCMSEMFRSHYKVLNLSVSKLKKYVQYRIAKDYEKNYYHTALLIHVITQRDRIWLETINPLARYHVVPNADLLNPGLVKDFNSPWDILIWGDLTIAACAQGTREFLLLAQQNPNLAKANKILIGKVSMDLAIQIIGSECMAQVSYSSRLEEEAGRMRSAKIFLIPDVGGAGIKNRVVNVVSSGLCLACLLPQMEGVNSLADCGAINAVNMYELVERIVVALETGGYERIAASGQAIYHDMYDLDSNRRLWRAMIERALGIRKIAGAIERTGV